MALFSQKLFFFIFLIIYCNYFFSILWSKLATQTLLGLKGETACLRDLPSYLRVAHEVTGCGYDYGTSWGKKVVWSYGSTTEDVLTGIKVHLRGW